MTVKVIIADDHQVVRQGLQGFLKLDPEIEIVGMAVNGLEAVEKTRQLNPDVVIIDLMMPVMSGLEATGIIKKSLPEVRILVLSNLQDDNSIAQALLAWAEAYFIKGKGVDKLVQAIKQL